MKTCNSCNHCSRLTPNNQGWCNQTNDKRPVLVKLDTPGCDQHFEGKLWRDNFGFTYRYDWQMNKLVCDQTGQTLDIGYLNLLRLIQD